MRQHEDALEALNVKVVVVTFEADFMAKAYVEQTQLRWPLLVDPERTTYATWDMLNASFWDLWGPATWWAYAKAIWAGQRLQASDADASQRGGDVLIDPDGVVRLHHVGDGPADRPEVAHILELVRGGDSS